MHLGWWFHRQCLHCLGQVIPRAQLRSPGYSRKCRRRRSFALDTPIRYLVAHVLPEPRLLPGATVQGCASLSHADDSPRLAGARGNNDSQGTRPSLEQRLADSHHGLCSSKTWLAPVISGTCPQNQRHDHAGVV